MLFCNNLLIFASCVVLRAHHSSLIICGSPCSRVERPTWRRIKASAYRPSCALSRQPALIASLGVSDLGGGHSSPS